MSRRQPLGMPVRLFALLQILVLIVALVPPVVVVAQDEASPVPAASTEPAPAATDRSDPDPTDRPEPDPTERPTAEPTAEPEATERATAQPTDEPAPAPTTEPTDEPTDEPTAQPSAEPSPEPSVEPSPEPSPEPTDEPTAQPTAKPSPAPSAEPSPEPSAQPSAEPSPEPSTEPSPEPSPEPSAEPSPEPSTEPSPEPSPEPSAEPGVGLPGDGPGISIFLAALTLTASASPASLPEPGGSATISVTVNNTSTNPATLTSLEDDVLGDLDAIGTCATGVTIAPNDVYACQYDIVVTGDPGDQVTHQVSALLTDQVDATTADGTDIAVVTITDVPSSIVVAKTASPLSLPEPGGTATYTVRVDNTSAVDAVTIENLIDVPFGNLAGRGTCVVPQTIAAGSFYSCTFTAAATGNAGATVTDTVTASGTDDDGVLVSGSDDASVAITNLPSSMTVTKTVSPLTLPEPGGTATYTVRIGNTSAADAITITSLVDVPYGSLAGRGTCVVPQTIAAGSAYTCTFTAPVTGNPGDVVTDLVTASGTDDDNVAVSASDDAAVTITDVASSMTLTKTASPTTLPESSGTVTFSVLVRNTSTTDAIVITSLVDDQHGSLAGQGTCAVPQTLAVGGTYSCSFTTLVSGNAGQVVTDTITASGTDDDGVAVQTTGSANVTFTDVLPSMTIDKTASPLTLPEPGGSVDFTVLVSNTSSEPITLSTLVDNQFGNMNGQGSCSVPQVIPQGGSYSCTFPGDVLGDAGDAHVDRVTAIAHDDENHIITGQDDARVTLTDTIPSITLDKQVTPAQVPEPGGQVQIRVEITNPSNEDVIVSSLTDSIHGSLSGQGTCVLPTTVRANGGTYTCSLYVTVTGEPGYTETDTVVAAAHDNENNPVTASDNATVTIIDVLPTMTVDKQAVPSSRTEPGGTYDVVVAIRNTSTVDALLVTSIVDVPHGNLNGQGTCSVPQTIPPGGTYTCTLAESLTGNAGASETDTVTVTGQDNEGNVIARSDSATFTVTDLIPQITVDKTATPASIPEPGGPVTFSVTITNDSPEQVTQLTIDDDVYGDLNGQGTCVTPVVLAPTGQPGSSYTCSFTRTITGDAGEAQIDIISATGRDDEGNLVEGTDTATVTITDLPPQLDVSKTIRPTTLPEPGGTVATMIRVENTGSEPVTITELVDDLYGDLDGVGGCSLPRTIPPGGVYACTFLETVSGNAGDVIQDTVTVTATDDDGNEATDTADASVTITDVPPRLVVSKSATPSSVSPPGGSVSFGITVRNLSTIEDLTLTSLVDAPYGDVTDPSNPQLTGTTCAVPQTIPPGGTYDCAFTGYVPWTAGGSTDVVTATGQDDDGGTASDTDGAHVGPGAPGVTMTKSARCPCPSRAGPSPTPSAWTTTPRRRSRCCRSWMTRTAM